MTGLEIPIILGLLVHAAIAIAAAAVIALAIFAIFKAVGYYKDSKNRKKITKKPTVVKTQEKAQNKLINVIKQPSLDIAGLSTSDSQSHINNMQGKLIDNKGQNNAPNKQVPNQSRSQSKTNISVERTL